MKYSIYRDHVWFCDWAIYCQTQHHSGEIVAINLIRCNKMEIESYLSLAPPSFSLSQECFLHEVKQAYLWLTGNLTKQSSERLSVITPKYDRVLILRDFNIHEGDAKKKKESQSGRRTEIRLDTNEDVWCQYVCMCVSVCALYGRMDFIGI